MNKLGPDHAVRIADVLRTMPIGMTQAEMNAWMVKHLGQEKYSDFERAVLIVAADELDGGFLQ